MWEFPITRTHTLVKRDQDNTLNTPYDPILSRSSCKNSLYVLPKLLKSLKLC